MRSMYFISAAGACTMSPVGGDAGMAMSCHAELYSDAFKAPSPQGHVIAFLWDAS